MDRLLSVFSVSDFLAFILPGGLVVSAYAWAVSGLPADLSLEQAIAAVAVFYVAGRFVQSIGSMMDRYVLVPLAARRADETLPADLVSLIETAMTLTFPREVAELQSHQRLQFVRSFLRRSHFSDRAELLNELHFVFRGFAAAGLLSFPAFLGAAICGQQLKINVIASSLSLVGTVIAYLRFRRFGERFERQLWVDLIVVTATKQA